MSDSDWFERHQIGIKKWSFRLFVGVLILGLGGAAIIRGLSEQSEYEWASYQRNSEYTADSYSPAYDACLRLSVDRQPDCVSKANNEYRENERKEQDLVAQQTTAVWTFLMGGAAIVGMMLSALGVYLVYTTFDETRKANGIAVDTNRAWISFVANENGHLTIGHDRIEYAISVNLDNHGARPAINVRGRIIAYINTEPKDLMLLARRMFQTGEDQSQVLTVFPNQKPELHMGAVQDINGAGSGKIVMVIGICYQDAATATERYTAEAFDFHSNDSGISVRTEHGVETLFHGQENAHHVARFTLHKFSHLVGIAT
jgi:hypothetical protein